MITVPYIFAYQMNTFQYKFGGFLINQADGHSYLAKMQQGYHGEWKFTLPYTAEAGEGAYLFFFYILLGHIARIVNLPLVFVFHIARIFGAIFLLCTIGNFFQRNFEDKRWQLFGYSISVLGSGMGWLAVLFGLFTSDFWVAEAYPFLSMYTNPHFSIGLSLMILLITSQRLFPIALNIILSLILGVIMPFGVVIVLLVLGSLFLTDIYSDKNLEENKIMHLNSLYRLLALGLGGGAVILYQYWIILKDPVLSLWNAQNITKSPSLLDFLISFSPILMVGIFGIKQAWNEKTGRILVLWALISFILISIPWNLQRRFLSSLYFPLSGLCVYGTRQLVYRKTMRFQTIMVLILVLVLPTNLVVVLSGINASIIQDPQVFFPTALLDGIEWINENTQENALVLTDEITGLFIPSLSGRRVIYGHPFETIQAEREKEFIKNILDGEVNLEYVDKAIAERGINYVFINHKLQKIPVAWVSSMQLIKVYNSDDISIYKTELP
jgi:hypothetical protein